MTLTTNLCALCSLELSSHIIVDEFNQFCCHGCQAVFNVLKSKNSLTNFREQPLFKQAVSSGLISNPLLLLSLNEETLKLPETDWKRLTFEIEEMWCLSCAEIIKLVLMQKKGIRHCIIDYTSDFAFIEFTPRHLSKDEIFTSTRQLGYFPTLNEEEKKTINKDLYPRLIVSLFCTFNVMMLAYPLYASYFNDDPQQYGLLFAWLSLIASLPVITYGAWPILKRFLTSIQVGLFGMETLVIIGTTTALILSLHSLMNGETQVYFDSMTTIISLVLLGKVIESKAKFSSKQCLKQLIRSTPRRARKYNEDGSSNFVLIKELAIGDKLLGVTGEKIALDGSVIEGVALCNESIMTGESTPVQKKPGSKIIAGSIIQNGQIIYKVSSLENDSTLQKILSIIQEQIEFKTPYFRAADSIVKWFIPFVITFAFASGLILILLGESSETAFFRTLSILLISCPCAIGIASPIVESQVLNNIIKQGGLVRNRGCLALLGTENVIIFDKTGTITEGIFTIINGLENLTEKELSLLKGLTLYSTHPISLSITESIKINPSQISTIQEVAGMGIKGTYNNIPIYIGSKKWLLQQGIKIKEDVIETPCTSCHFAIGTQYLTEILLGDRLKEGIKDLIKALLPAKCILLSGDKASCVSLIAEECGFNEWKAEVTPLEKSQFIQELRARGITVAMFGDGINDAPALTSANIGISVVSASDISIQVSDLLLTINDLRIFSSIRNIALHGQKIMKQNLFFAFIYNFIGLFLAATGNLSPIFAAFAMTASSLMVILNAKRVLEK